VKLMLRCLGRGDCVPVTSSSVPFDLGPCKLDVVSLPQSQIKRSCDIYDYSYNRFVLNLSLVFWVSFHSTCNLQCIVHTVSF